MGSDVKRYTMEPTRDEHGDPDVNAMVTNNGRWVAYSTYRALEAERDRLEKMVGSMICRPVIEVRDMAEDESGGYVDDVVFVNGQILDELDGERLADQLKRALGSFQPQPMTDAEVKVQALEAERDELRELIRSICPPAWDDERMDYVEVQIDKDDYARMQALGGNDGR